MRFTDLFSGLGGFHLALRKLGHECVFASEIDPALRKIYKENFCIEPVGDIRDVAKESIPEHEILCAGFPCQPFSKAGEQNGFKCPTWGDLFSSVISILKSHKPQYVLLENVPNLMKHDDGKTWTKVVKKLKSAGYESDARILSPHQFGVPQIRERVYIVARRGGLKDFDWPALGTHPNLHINSILIKNPPDAKRLSKQVTDCLKMWQKFITRYPKDKELPTFPIWAMEFGADYPYEKFAPASLKRSELRKYRGAYGKPLADTTDAELIDALPPYARQDKKKFPDWKVDFIRQNRELYIKHKEWIDEWKDQLLAFPASLQKLEWNCKGGERDIWKYILQFRASGVRVKKPSTAPSLIAMTSTQVPIIAWEKRYMTPSECAKLQSMESLKVFPESSTAAYKAFGNAINVHVMQLVAEALLGKLPKNVRNPRSSAKPSQRRSREQNEIAA